VACSGLGAPGVAPRGTMSRSLKTHGEGHRGRRGGWLRAAVLGADDGVVSTTSLIIGVAAASASKEATLLAGVAGLVAGALSMAAGEYVSVSSQRDAELADIGREREELATDPRGELRELTRIYEKRGLDPDLARKVAEQLSAKDRLGSHLRDELGLDEAARARPLQAALVSAASFASLAALPILALVGAPASWRILLVALVSLSGLGVLGALGGYLGGAPMGRAALRVMLGGAAAMAATALIGHLLGVAGID
jgi:VIT1/CCC1 family predicted Fe2+/Mn2+ transporter